jgi:hypothetical protein
MVFIFLTRCVPLSYQGVLYKKPSICATLSVTKGLGLVGFIRLATIPTPRFFVILPEEGILRMTFDAKPRESYLGRGASPLLDTPMYPRFYSS